MQIGVNPHKEGWNLDWPKPHLSSAPHLVYQDDGEEGGEEVDGAHQCRGHILLDTYLAEYGGGVVPAGRDNTAKEQSMWSHPVNRNYPGSLIHRNHLAQLSIQWNVTFTASTLIENGFCHTYVQECRYLHDDIHPSELLEEL